MIVDSRMIATTGTLLTLACAAIGITVGTRLPIRHRKRADQTPISESACPENTIPVCSVTEDHISIIDYSQESSIIATAWQMAYKRLGESEESELSESERAVLLCEAATDIRYAIDRGTRCVLVRNGAPKCPQKLKYRINDCAQYMNPNDIKDMHQIRMLCNQIIHSGRILENTHNRLLNAAKLPGMLLRLVDSYV